MDSPCLQKPQADLGAPLGDIFSVPATLPGILPGQRVFMGRLEKRKGGGKSARYVCLDLTSTQVAFR